MSSLLADKPYSLEAQAEVEKRLRMLRLPHIAPLTRLVARIRSRSPRGFEVPNFDPCDGGVRARVLFLLEAPGPNAVRTGFVSRNNPDPTAASMLELLEQAGFTRRDTLLWNIVPWYVGSLRRIRPVRASEIRAASPYLEDLLRLLPRLRVIVLVGLKARTASSSLAELTEARVLSTYHPSQRVLNVWPERRSSILRTFRQAAKEIRTAA